MPELIDLERARVALDGVPTTTAEDATLERLIAAATAGVAAYCGQDFTAADADETLPGTAGDVLLLSRYPLIEVRSVAANPTVALTVRNAGASVSRASAVVRATGLRLLRTASGVTSTDDSVTWASSATVSAVAAAVNALGNGWAASAEPGLEGFASAELVLASVEARQSPAQLTLYRDWLGGWDVHPVNGWLSRRGSLGAPGWPERPGGYRVRYRAGYDALPADLQEACAQWVAALYWQAKGDPSSGPTLPPRGVQRLLAPHRRRRI